MILTLKEYEGLTGPVSFDETGRRKNYKINIYQVELNKPFTRVNHFNNIIEKINCKINYFI